MTYKLDPIVEKIDCKVEVKIDNETILFESGHELAKAVFDRRYLISSIKADNTSIEIQLEEAKPLDGNASFF